MSRRGDTRPEVRLTINGATFLLSSIVPKGGWGGLKHSHRRNGAWAASWKIPKTIDGWTHPALVYGARVEIMLGPIVVWSGTLDEPDWDAGTFTATGAYREAETTLGFDTLGNASAKPNEAIDTAITNGDLTWTRIGDFGNTAIGDLSGGPVSLTSILDGWAKQNPGYRWYVNDLRQLDKVQISEAVPKWHIVPGSGVLGSASEQRVDRIYARYIDSATGARATTMYPTTGTAKIKKTAVLTKYGPMSAAAAQAMAQGIWTENNSGRPGFTNGWTLTHGQITTPGAVIADGALVKANDPAAGLGIYDTRGIGQNTLVVLGDTEYDWEDDKLQANPNGLVDSDDDSALERVGNLAVAALAAASSGGSFVPFQQEVFVWNTAYSVGTTTPGNVGNTITIPSAGTSAIYLATFCVVGSTPNGVINFVSFSIDGNPWNSDIIRAHSPNANWFTVTRTAVLTGLSAGNHTVGIRSWNNAAGTTTHNGPDSTLNVVRIA